MASTNVRQQKQRRPEFGYSGSNAGHNNRNQKNRWGNNNSHGVISTRNQPPNNTQSPNSQHHNHAQTIASTQNVRKQVDSYPEDTVAAKHMHDRLLFLLTLFAGKTVVVTVKDGTKYEGLFHTACTDTDMGVILKFARKLPSKPGEKMGKALSTFIILAKDCMDIYAANIDLSANDKPNNEREGFRTDTDISGRTEIRERELHKWTPDDLVGSEIMVGLEDEPGMDAGNGNWDQFAANEQLFGLKTDFDEEIYTTKLDRSKADFKERERQAIQLANEITKTQTTNVHVLEERGVLIDDSQMDEEDRYGAVNQNSKSPRTPTQPLIPLSPVQQQSNPIPVPAPVPTPVKKLEPSASQLAKDMAKEATKKSLQDQKSNAPGASAVPPNGNKTSSLNGPNSLAHFRIAEPVAAYLHSQMANRKIIEGQGKPIEKEIVGTFKQFVNTEKERLQQKKQAIFQKEMDGKVAELKKWGLNFKLKSSPPEDLIPILTNDEAKRQALATKNTTINNQPTIYISTAPPEKDHQNTENSEKKDDKLTSDVNRSKDIKSEEKRDKPQDVNKTKKEDKSSHKGNVPSQIEQKSDGKKINTAVKVNEDKSKSLDRDGKNTGGENKNSAEKNTNAEKTNTTLSNSSSLGTASRATTTGSKSTWKPNPNAASFTPTTPTSATSNDKSPASSPFLSQRQLKRTTTSFQGNFTPFHKSKPIANPSTIPPIWPFGQRPFRLHFSSQYEEDMYTPNVPSQFGFQYAVASPQFRYPTQYVGVPPTVMQQAPMYMPQGHFVPFASPPMPAAGGPPQVMYNPQMPSGMPPQHFSAQGFPSPNRTPMVPGMHPPMYPPYQQHVAMPPMMRYTTPHEMVAHVPPNGVMMGQRPMMMEQYHVQGEGAPMEAMQAPEPTPTQQ
ncbi:771_t:CDS:10 [Paraglomus occultum]|uniref:771_t:CDS:1 n=1 Tax=Paraglomus occultum TaxID=144539 RepID=A0A9N9G9Z5_9GLOM|nr:771_t:CDS:10 [Paraglomus occultum]